MRKTPDSRTLGKWVNFGGMNRNSPESATDAHPSHEQITLRAEHLWNREGFPNGRDEQIWLEAERQLLEEAGKESGGTAAPKKSDALPSDSGRRAKPASPQQPTSSSGKRRSSGNV